MEPLYITTGFATGNPLTLSGRHGGAAIEAGSHFKPDPGAPRIHAFHKATIQARRFFCQQPYMNPDTGFAEHVEPPSGDRRIRILRGRKHAGYARINQRSGAGRCAPKMTAWLQSDIGCSATGIRASLAQCPRFRMGFAGPFMPALAQNPVATGYHAANPGVGVR